MSYTIDRHNIHEYLGIEGVGGPGDDFMSSGPHGETSAQAQEKATHPFKPSGGEGGFFDSVFDDFGAASDDEVLHGEAQPIGPEFSETADNIMNDPDIFAPDPVTNPVVHGGGVPIAVDHHDDTPLPGISPDAQPSASAPMSNTSLLLIVAAVIGVGYAVLGK